MAVVLLDALTWLFSRPAPCGTSKDITELILEDHNRVRALHAQYQRPGNTTQQKQLLARDIIRHSSFHSKREDMVLGPALAACTGHMGAAALTAQHQHLEELLEVLLHTPVTDPSFDTLLGRYMRDTEDHLQAEEQQLLPGLVQALRQEQLMALGRVFEWAKLIAPSRPHPWAPKAPVFSHVVNALLVPLDFLKDCIVFEGAPTL